MNTLDFGLNIGASGYSNAKAPAGSIISEDNAPQESASSKNFNQMLETTINRLRSTQDMLTQIQKQAKSSGSTGLLSKEVPSGLRKQMDFLDAAIEYSQGNIIHLDRPNGGINITMIAEADPKDTPLTRAEIQQMTLLLRQADSNRDGIVSTRELAELRAKCDKKIRSRQEAALGKLIEEALYGRENTKLKSLIGADLYPAEPVAKKVTTRSHTDKADSHAEKIRDTFGTNHGLSGKKTFRLNKGLH
jgi:hypothetical protein